MVENIKAPSKVLWQAFKLFFRKTSDTEDTKTRHSAPMSAAVFSHATPAALRPGPPGQPDITYAPDWEKYLARVAARLKSGGLAFTLPQRFPDKLSGDLVWEGETLANTYDWTYVLDAEQLNEIEEALKHFKCRSSQIMP